MKPAVLVTGATGFVGAALVRELRSRGHRVVAFARANSPRAELADLDLRWCDGDLLDRASLERALAQTCELSSAPPWVVHAAAVISYRTRDQDLQRRVNVEGTRNVLAACRGARLGRLLHVSSVVAVGHARPRETLDEDAPYNCSELRCDYADTKRKAECLALEVASDLDVVVVNPGAIFGPGARGPNTVKFLRALARGPHVPFVPPGSLSVVGVRDVASGCLLTLEHGRRGRRYLLTESVWTSIDCFGLAARLLGVRPPRWTAPGVAWKALEFGARAIDVVASPGLLTPTAVRMLGAHFRFDSSRARTELGWAPAPFERVLGETVDWLRSRGEL
jgi:dihydroflavonol-4-reductase